MLSPLSFLLASRPSNLLKCDAHAYLSETLPQQIAVAKALVNVRTQLTLRSDGGDSDDAEAVVCVEPVLAPKLAFIEVCD